MRNIIIVVGLAGTLAGCVTAAQQQEQFTAAVEQCKGAGGTAVAKVQCGIAADNRIYGGETPLMAWKHAEMLKIALRVDKGQITKEEAQVEGAQIDAEVKLKAQQLDMQQAAINQAAMANTAVALQKRRGIPPSRESTAASTGHLHAADTHDGHLQLRGRACEPSSAPPRWR
jgi:hypothetical protein